MVLRITVYKDTIFPDHTDDDNLCVIEAEEKDVKEWWEQDVKQFPNESFDDWYDNYSADETMDLFLYLKSKNKWLKIDKIKGE